MNFSSISPAEYTESLFGTIVKDRREEIGLSLRGLARKVGVSATYLSDIERGDGYPIVGSKIMNSFISALQISDADIPAFTDIAYFGRHKISKRLNDYLANNKIAMETVALAERLGIKNEQWQSIFDSIIASVAVSKD